MSNRAGGKWRHAPGIRITIIDAPAPSLSSAFLIRRSVSIPQRGFFVARPLLVGLARKEREYVSIPQRGFFVARLGSNVLAMNPGVQFQSPRGDFLLPVKGLGRSLEMRRIFVSIPQRGFFVARRSAYGRCDHLYEVSIPQRGFFVARRKTASCRSG
jgi:hypothetical protein